MPVRPRKRRWFGLLPGRAPTAPPVDPRRFDEAVDFFRARVPMPKGEWLRLGTAARQRGFTVADVTQLDVINQVWLALDDAVANGATFDDFKTQVGRELTDAWAGSVENPPARLETIFRNGVMQSNNAGRDAQMRDPVILDRRPYWQYVDIDDQRECLICTACHGTILRWDDPWWQTHSPQLHHRCRCRRRPLTVAQAESMGVTSSPPTVRAQEGFGAPPAQVAPPWEPDLSKYPPELQRVAREKMEAS